MIHDAIKEGDEEFLAEVLEALNRKYGQAEDSLEAYVKREDKTERNISITESTNHQNRKEKENNVGHPNQVSSEECIVDKGDLEENNGKLSQEESKEILERDKVEDEDSNSDKHRVVDKQESRKGQSEALATNLQELENAFVHFARNTKDGKTSENHEKELSNKEAISECLRKVLDMKDTIGDLKNEVIAGDTKKERRLWDAPNEIGETPLLVTTSLNKSALTNMLLDCNPNVNIQNADGDTALHNTARHGAIDEATRIIEMGGNLILNKKDDPPPMEKLFDGQDPTKVEKLMSAILNSHDKKNYLRTIFEQKRLLFKITDPELIRAVVDTKKPDPDLTYFVNLQDPKNNNNNALHIAVDQRECHESASWLLKAGDYQLKANDDALTPGLEILFTEEKKTLVTSHIVKGLIRKVGMGLLKTPDGAVRYIQLSSVLCLELEVAGGLSLFSLVEDKSIWKELLKVIGFEIKRFAPTMPTEFAEWLVTMAPSEGWSEYDVHLALLEKNLYGKSSYDRLNLEDSDHWEKLTAAVGIHVACLAPRMGADFVKWLLKKTDSGEVERWVYRHLLDPNSQGNIALAHITDPNTWSKIAEVLGPHKIAESASYMGAEFADWMWKKKDEKAWDKLDMYRTAVNQWG